MSKKPITWIELLKEKISLKGKGTSIGDVAPEAKKEWVQIKEGKHPKYTQGKMTKSSTKKNKAGKMNKGKRFSKKNNSSMMSQLLSSKKICSSCKKEIKRMMNKSQSGGDEGEGSCGKTTDELSGQSGGGCGCGGISLMSGGSCGGSSCSAMPNDGSLLSQNGGKKGKRGSKKSKKSKKGKKSGKKTRKGKKHGGSNMDDDEEDEEGEMEEGEMEEDD